MARVTFTEQEKRRWRGRNLFLHSLLLLPLHIPSLPHPSHTHSPSLQSSASLLPIRYSYNIYKMMTLPWDWCRDFLADLWSHNHIWLIRLFYGGHILRNNLFLFLCAFFASHMYEATECGGLAKLKGLCLKSKTTPDTVH